MYLMWIWFEETYLKFCSFCASVCYAFMFIGHINHNISITFLPHHTLGFFVNVLAKAMFLCQ